jgi:acyl-CoA thioesterase-2
MDGRTLTETLALERIEVNLFRGHTPPDWTSRIYGGQVIAQSLLAANETVENRPCHSFHCYFIRPGDPSIPIIFEVDRSRDGGSFTTRRVIAVQHGQQIFNLAASFQKAEVGPEHQTPAPAHQHWSELPDEARQLQLDLEAAPGRNHDLIGPAQFIELRRNGSFFDPSPRPPENQVWFRARHPIGPEPFMHQVMLAYASDMVLIPTALRPHPGALKTVQSASIDHAMWFHNPLNFDNWHLYTQYSPVASAGRGFIRGEIYAEDGTLVASVVQEGLMRRRTKPRTSAEPPHEH